VLRHRLLVGTLLVAAFAGFCWLEAHQSLNLPRGAWLFPVALVLSLLASGEVLQLLKSAGYKPIGWLVYVGNFLVIAASGVPIFGPARFSQGPLETLGWPLVALTIVVLAALAIEVIRYRPQQKALANLLSTIFAVTYVGLLMSFLVQLDLLKLLSLIIVVKMADTGAYTIGRLIGRHKMTPHLSPGKTWEGVFGALLFAVLGSWIVFTFLRPHLTNNDLPMPEAWQCIAYAIIIAIAGMFGDLAESLLKREAGQKNSSSWMPGLGGVLDVLDSILFTAPVAYLCWALQLVR
jgi:phosphatidate cytidylyltransferase